MNGLTVKECFISKVSIVALMVAIVSWLPRQEAAYVLPFIIYAFWALVGRFSTSIITLHVIAVFIVFPFYLLIGYLHTPDTGYAYRIVIWLITHASIVLLLVGYSFGGKLKDVTKFFNLLIILGVFESLLAVYQYAQGPGFSASGAAGDLIIGTLGSNSHLFALKVLSTSFISFMFYRKNKRIRYLLAAILMLLAWMFASAMHTVVVIVLLVPVYYLLNSDNIYKKVKSFGLITVLSIMCSFLFLLIYSNAYVYVVNKLSFTNAIGQTYGKVEYMKRTAYSLPYDNGPAIAMFGVGPGNYSSRASWIASGEYLASQKYLPVSPSGVWKKYQYDIWNKDLLINSRWTHGVANQPFSSWFTILGELGWVAVIFVIYISVKILLSLRKAGRLNKEAAWIMNIGSMSLLFLIFSCFFDNWLEYPRFTMPILFLVGLLYKHSIIIKSSMKQF